jgi:hypothetical protein
MSQVDRNGIYLDRNGNPNLFDPRNEGKFGQPLANKPMNDSFGTFNSMICFSLINNTYCPYKSNNCYSNNDDFSSSRMGLAP